MTETSVSIPLDGPDSPALKALWSTPLSELVPITLERPSAEVAERHRIYALLLMALVYTFWCGNKNGRQGTYPLRPQQLDTDHQPEDLYKGGDYHGHNIAAIAVDGIGRVIDFDFNHNELFNSSVEHAEARLLRRLFSLSNLNYSWRPALPAWPRTDMFKAADLVVPQTNVRSNYSTILDGVTIYTSLESCAQCSGIMTLACVPQVVYLQHDLSQNYVGNVLRYLTTSGAPTSTPIVPAPGATPTSPSGSGAARQPYAAPLPIAGQQIDFDYSAMLDTKYKAFVDKMSAQGAVFYEAPGTKFATSSPTAFLCTDDALGIFEQAHGDFQNLCLKKPHWNPCKGTYTNEKALLDARGFFDFAKAQGRRGTPHL